MTEALGIDVRWRVDRHLSFSQVLHNILLTRVMLAAHVFCREYPGFRLTQERICYEFPQKMTPGGEDKEKRSAMSVVPDGWLLFSSQRKGGEEHVYPVLLEVDRGTMFRERFKKHVLSRVGFVASGEYERVFGTPAVMIAYVATGTTGQASAARHRSLCSWTKEALAEEGREGWEQVLRLCSVNLDGVYGAGLFERNVWHRPDKAEPIWLFGK